jgi:hypothetical protein
VRWFLFSVLLLVATLSLSACEACAFRRTNTPLTNPSQCPTAISEDEAKPQIEEMLYKSFNRCSNDPDLVYGVSGRYLHEMRSARIYDISESWTRPSEADLCNGIRWVGTATITAEVYRRYDIPNRQKLAAGEGAGLPQTTFTVMHQNGEWVWELSQAYTTPSCADVQKVLDSADR